MPGIIIPFYAYPKLWLQENEWARLARCAQAYPALPLRAVINPASGPGTGQGPDYDNYAAGIRLLKDAGVSVAGYADTAYATRPLDEVRSEIDCYQRFYPGSLSGIFFDQMAHTAGKEDYYWEATQQVREAGFSYSIGNPGVLLPASYAGCCNILNIYENVGYADLAGLLGPLRTDPAYGGKDAYSILCYNVERLDTHWVRAASGYVKYLYVAGRGEERDWDRLPGYFEAFLNELAGLA